MAIGLEQKRGILRYSVGSTLILAISAAYAFPLSFILPVLSLGFFAPGNKVPSIKDGLLFVLVVAVASMIGSMIAGQIDKPFVMLLLISTIFINVFYSNARWLSPMLKTWILIALLLLPMMNLLYPDLASQVGYSLVIGALLSVVLVWLAFALFPDVKSPANKAVPVAAPPAIPANIRLQKAILSTLVILPVFILIYMFKLAGSVLILVFVGILSMQPESAKNFKAGAALIIGNVAGGVISIILFNLLVFVPELTFLVLVILLTGFLLGIEFFKGKKPSPLYNMAFSTILLVIGSVTASGDGEASEKVFFRVLQIAAAVGYVVIVFGIIEKWKDNAKSGSK